MDIPLTVYGVASLGFEVGLVEVRRPCPTPGLTTSPAQR
jgi:hypothetical protein